MLGRTHVATGLAAGLTFAVATNTVTTTPLLAFGVAGAAALLPDLDQPASLAGSRLGLQPASWVLRLFGHRTFTHSLVALGLFALLVARLVALRPAGYVLPSAYLDMAIIGFVSHLAADGCTKEGIELLWPLPRRFYLMPFSGLRVSTVHDERLPWQVWRLQAYVDTERLFFRYPVYACLVLLIVNHTNFVLR